MTNIFMRSPFLHCVLPCALTLGLLGVALPAPAATLRLTEAFREAAARNLQIEIARASEAAARAEVGVSEGRFDLYLTGAAETLQRSVEGENFGAQLRYNLGLAKLFSSGTALTVLGGGSQVWGRPDKAKTLLNPPWQRDAFFFNDPAYGALALTLEQPLLRGAGFASNEALVRSAAALLQSAQVALEARLAAELRNVEVEYWSWAAAVRTIEIRRASLKLAEAQVRRTRELIRKGRQTKSDALLAEQIVADRQDALAVADSDAAARYERLYHLMGFALDEIPRPPREPEAFPDASSEVEPIAELLERATQAAYLPRQVAHEQAAVEHRLVAAEDASWPELTASARLEVFGSDSAFGGAWSDTVSSANHIWSGQLRFSYPLGVNTAAAEAQRLQARLTQQRAILDDATRRTRLSVAAARRDLLLAINRIELATLAMNLASQKLGAEEERYAIGRTTMQDLRQFQEDLDATSLRQVQARVAYMTARAQLDYLLGRYVESRGLSAAE